MTGVNAIINQTEKSEIKDYLLGRLGEQDEERVEVRLLTDQAFGEELDIAVNELTDQYVTGEVQGSERAEMERYFFAAPERRQKLRVAEALKQRQQLHPKKHWQPIQLLKIAASILIVAGLNYGAWQMFKSGPSGSEMDQGLAALQNAYQTQRPFEARISGLPHGEYSSTRGSEKDGSQAELRRAELYLDQAAEDKPGPEVQHALGKVYLAQGNVDAAIKQFEEVLKAQPHNAQIYNDLGVAWMQKGDLNRSLESLNKALELDNNSLEALFNRALCYERLSRTEEAKADWREYLKRDPSSPWAKDARQKL